MSTLFRLALLFALTCHPYSWAQSPTRDISGVVLSGGEAVKVAEVTITNKATGRKWSVITDSAGGFSLQKVPWGDYDIQAQADGYTSDGPTFLRIGPEFSKRIEVILVRVNPPDHPKRAAPKPSPARLAPPPPPPSPTAAAVQIQPKENYTTVRIFYATDRKQADRSQPALFYGGARREADGNAAALELGQCDVSIPHTHEIGELESPVWWKFEFRPDPELHIVLLSVEPEDSNRYFADMRQRVVGSPSKDAFVFIHGYNTTFEDAARRTAQMAYDLKFQGAPILYSWPSEGELAKYTYDENNVEWSWRHLYDFLQTLSTQSGATTIHLIAHSMGNRALANALQRMPKSATPLFREVILAAPDIDADLFKQMAADMQGKASRITLYASSKDDALKASKAAHGEPRAGDSDKIVIVAGVDSIDASSAATDFLGHGYVFKDSILFDINNLFRQGKPPQQRERLKPEQMGSLLYWLLAP